VTATTLARTERRPSVMTAFWVFVGYTAIVLGIMWQSGVPYRDFFATADNAFRAPVLALAAGSVFLAIVVAVCQWDGIWRDPGKLGMSWPLWLALAVMVVGTVLRFFGVDWSAIPSKLVLAVLCTGILVGFAEEMLFRGIVLRSLRNGVRPEGVAVILMSVWFGLFHLPNMLIGGGVETLGQVVLATLSGVVLYLARRGSGLIVVGMVLHGAYDMSTFFIQQASAKNAATDLAFWCFVLTLLLGFVALIVVFRRDRKVTMTTTGPAPIPIA